MVGGAADEGYGPVADAFRANFAERGELGAACAVYRDGRKVVDLWGGHRDAVTQAPWEEDTLVPMFSTTKGVASMALAVAHSRGLLDYDEAVARYWPEFGAAGKERVTVRQLLSHQAGLCAIDERLELADLLDHDRVAAVIAAQRPAWEPGTRHGYHGITLGWYEGELIRRVDPQRRTLGRFFAEEVADPLGLDFFIGLPDDVPPARVARIDGYTPPQMLLHLREFPPRFVLGFLNPRSLTYRTFGNPRITGLVNEYNRRELQRAEIPAANGIGTPRSVARAYGEFATGGAALGLREETLDALRRPAAAPSGGRIDAVLHIESVFSLGYCKPFPRFTFGSSADLAFGTPGAGGSFGFADPDTRIGFAYAMNRTGFRLYDDPRELALREALYRCLGERSQSGGS